MDKNNHSRFFMPIFVPQVIEMVQALLYNMSNNRVTLFAAWGDPKNSMSARLEHHLIRHQYI